MKSIWQWISRKKKHTPVRPALQRVIERAHTNYFVPRLLERLPHDIRWGDEVVINRNFKLKMVSITDPERIRVEVIFVDEGITRYFIYNADTGEFSDEP